MRGQCGIAVVAASLVTAGNAVTPAATSTRDAAVGLPRGSIPVPCRSSSSDGGGDGGSRGRRKPSRESSPSSLTTELERTVSSGQKLGGSCVAYGRGDKSQLHVLSRSWRARLPPQQQEQQEQQPQPQLCVRGSADATTECPQFLLSSSKNNPGGRDRRKKGGIFVGPAVELNGAYCSSSSSRRSSVSKGNIATPSKHVPGGVHMRCSKLKPLSVRGGGGGGTIGWFGRGGDVYDEFPADFDYDDEPTTMDSSVDSNSDRKVDSSGSSSSGGGGSGDSTGDDTAVLSWMEDDLEDEEEQVRSETTVTSAGQPSRRERERGGHDSEGSGNGFSDSKDLCQGDQDKRQRQLGSSSNNNSDGGNRQDRRALSSGGLGRQDGGQREREEGSAASAGAAGAAAASAAGSKLSGVSRWPAHVEDVDDDDDDDDDVDDDLIFPSEVTASAATPEGGTTAVHGDPCRVGMQLQQLQEMQQPQQQQRRRQQQRSVIGAVVGALAGALGLKLWEGCMQRRRDGGGGGGGVRDAAAATNGGVASGDGRGEVEGELLAEEEGGIAKQQAKIQALEDQLAFLEEDRRRVALAAKEARSNRRKDDRQLKEYVHTLEVHLDQLSKEKQESEASMVEKVREETAKALEQAQEVSQATAVKAAEELARVREELESTQALLETALQEKAAAVQEKAASDALLRTEQGKGAVLEKEVERLRESTVALTQRLLDAVAKAERTAKEERDSAEAKATAEEEQKEASEAAVAAAVAAAREEETARCRKEMETALAEEKDKLRKQLEARVATMRAGLKRRLQEARAERAGNSGAGARGGESGSVGGSSASSPLEGPTRESGEKDGQ